MDISPVQSLGRVQKRFASPQHSQRPTAPRATPSQSGGGSDDFYDAQEQEPQPAATDATSSANAEEMMKMMSNTGKTGTDGNLDGTPGLIEGKMDGQP
jgi:hypothetical protein